jgi:hypothetical protein
MKPDEFECPELAREIDRLCDRFENEWKQGKRPRIETYLELISSDKRPPLLRQLLFVEWQFQLENGQNITPAEFRDRFPGHDTTVSVAWRELVSNGETNLEAPPDAKLPATSAENEIPKSLGRYRIKSLLGQGGCGSVFLAHDEELLRDVAIKVTRPELIRPQDIEALVAEARTLAALDHPNIVPVYDVGRTEDCPFYVVSKYMDGHSLSEVIQASRPTPRVSATLVATVAEALQAAHEKKIVHRDVKPANILLDSAGRPHLADFGLALSDELYGEFQGVIGTPAYMSPEQVRKVGHLVDGRTDVFSLGVVLYELLTGERPFVAVTRSELMDRIASVDARPPRQLNGSLPAELERICLKALSKQPSDRYTTAGDMAAELRAFLGGDTSPAVVGNTGSAVSEPQASPAGLKPATADEVRNSDIVISCAQLDDQPLGPADDGWVSRFQANLKVRMEQLLGESIQVASLPMSPTEQNIEDTVLDSVSDAKTLVSVVSPSFTKTPGCLKSVKGFWESAERAGQLCVDDKPRVFKVMKSPVPSEDIPTDLGELLSRLFGFEFFEQDPSTGRVREFDEVFGPQLKQRFHERVYDLAHDVSQLLRAYRKTGAAAGLVRDVESAPVVYLATTTSDVQDQRDRIRRELIERGCVVLPDTSPPLSSQELERFVQNCLQKSNLAIHILGRHYGVTPEDCDQSLPALQLTLSARHAQQSKLQRLLFFPPEKESGDQRQADFLRSIQENADLHCHAELIEGDMSLLKSIVVSRLTRPVEKEQENTDSDSNSGPPKLYLVCESRDEKSIEPLEDYLFAQGLEVCLPAFDGSDADAVALHRDNLATCDAVLIYYGAAPRAWVDIKLRDTLKATGYGRKAPIDQQGVFIAPPMDHRKTRFKSLQSKVIRSAESIHANADLNEFIAAIKRS